MNLWTDRAMAMAEVGHRSHRALAVDTAGAFAVADGRTFMNKQKASTFSCIEPAILRYMSNLRMKRKTSGRNFMRMKAVVSLSADTEVFSVHYFLPR